MRIAGFQSFAVLCIAVCTHGWHCPGNRFTARLLFERRSRCVWLLLAGEHRPVQRLLAARLRVLSDKYPMWDFPVGSRRRRISLHLCRRVPPSGAVGPTLGLFFIVTKFKRRCRIDQFPSLRCARKFSLFRWNAVDYRPICGGDCYVPRFGCQPGGVGTSTASSFGPF